MRPEHIEGAVKLQRDCFPPPFPDELLWQPGHLAQHLVIFPEGQFVAMDAGRVIGSASSLRISRSVWQDHESWELLTGGHSFSSHDPGGEILYGADISVHPESRGKGVARALYAARFELVTAEGMRMFATCCRIPGWREWSSRTGGGTHEQYCDLVVASSLADPTLTPLLRMGMCFRGLAYDYMEDEESGDAAAVLEWEP